MDTSPNPQSEPAPNPSLNSKPQPAQASPPDSAIPLELPSHDQLVSWGISLLPFTRQGDFRTRIIEALEKALPIVREEAAKTRRRLQASPEQRIAQVNQALETFYYKTLIDPDDPNDQRTAPGYLRVRHEFTRYSKNVASLKQALQDNGIPIHPKTSVISCIRSMESVPLPESVLQSDLDKFVEQIREKEAARQRAQYERRKSGPEKSSG